MPRRKRSAVFVVQGRTFYTYKYTTALDNGLNVNEKKKSNHLNTNSIYIIIKSIGTITKNRLKLKMKILL